MMMMMMMMMMLMMKKSLQCHRPKALHLGAKACWMPLKFGKEVGEKMNRCPLVSLFSIGEDGSERSHTCIFFFTYSIYICNLT